MINYIENVQNQTLLTTSECFFSSQALNKKSFYKMLEKHWEIYLVFDINREYDIDCDKNKDALYFLQIHISSKLNYLIIAKIVDSLCNSYKLQYVIKDLAKTEFQCQNLVKTFSLNTVPNSIFVRWLFLLWLELFYQYIKRYTSYILTSRFFCNLHNIKIQCYNHFLLCSSKDIVILKLYCYRSQMWDSGNESINKKKIAHKVLKVNGNSSGISCLYYKIKFRIQNKANNISRKIAFHHIYKLKKILNIFAKHKYMNIVKNIIQSNKGNLQANIIQKINIFIKSWNRYWSIFLIKNDYQLLNKFFSKTLWRWGKSRHGNKSATWIKKRYWHKFKDDTYFSKY